MQYGANWYINSAKTANINIVMFHFRIFLLYKVKNDQYGWFCYLKIRYMCTTGHSNVKKTIFVFTSRHKTFTIAYS